VGAIRHDKLPAAVRRGFFDRPVDEVARDLLGCYLVRSVGEGSVGGRIVETEAYGGPGDPGSHADRAPNGRARIMFGPWGVVYVYFTYGMHHCMNIVTGPEGTASAVLLRAIEPVWGVPLMRRGAPESLSDGHLASGPGRICRALGVDLSLNGTSLADGPIRVLRSRGTSEESYSGLRVGLSSDDGRPWRFWLPSPSVSRSRTPRPGTRS
jgi:DNA-3-methyladenine glycosylase